MGVEHPYKAPAGGQEKPEAEPPRPPRPSFLDQGSLPAWISQDAMQPQLLLFLCLLLPASQSPVRSPQLLLDILGPDLALVLYGHEDGGPLPPLGSSPPPLGGHLPPRTLTQPPEHPWLHLLQEFAKTHPRRLRGRFRKGAQPGCFGIKLDRIGTFSGLGC